MYCLDTSALIEAWTRTYPRDVFPSLWENFDIMIKEGKILCPDEVHEELKKKEDDLLKWADSRKDLFYALDDDLQAVTSEILSEFPRLVDTKKNRSQADPFVIGLAQITGRKVVSEEKNNGTLRVPKIPFVCEHYNVECIKLVEMIREEGWSF